MTAAIALLGTVAPVFATPPGIPTAFDAGEQLNELQVQPKASISKYDRALFSRWIRISGTCDTRETVLIRDGTNIVIDSNCASVSGSWYSPYDGATWDRTADVDIDHVVPLKEAWASGASSWTTDKRRQFANDLSNPQLMVVTDRVNQAKGDKGPTKWLPPLASYHCTYAKAWIRVKYVWDLSVDSDEKSTLTRLLETC
ncbi:hypothetical protein BGZ83_001548 [Gryganskiella cystojenkinii]|nr:hypothetical protein BGZ83_001548 [Gryganskiella cystojenkinii]